RQRLQHEFHARTTGCALSTAYLKACKSASRAVIKCISRCVIHFHASDILDLSAEQLQYIPKIVLLRVYGYIDHVWVKLPEHVKADSEIRTYRRCGKHYNQPWQRTHIDGPAPKIKDCSECRRRAVVYCHVRKISFLSSNSF
ncbi:hypothetical protein ALC60_03735, partial [Trachymyrmex zeteki]